MERTLLIADTESWAVEAATSTARAAGLGIVVAATGPDALDLHHECVPAAVILDGLLPVMDGLMVAHRIRQTLTGSIVPVIVTLALPEERPEELRRANGLTAVLPKPYTTSDLSGILEPFLPRFETPLWDVHLPESPEWDIAAQSVAMELMELKRRTASGRLVAERDGIVKALLVAEGDVVDVVSNSERDGWSQWLARDPMLSPERRLTAAHLSEETPFASFEDLRELGLIKADEEAQVRARRLTSITLDVLGWEHGRLFWLEEQVEQGEGRLNGHRLALWGLRLRPDLEGLMAHLPAPEERLERNWSSPQLDLTSLELQVAGLAGDDRTVAEVLMLGRMVQVDAKAALARLVATTALEVKPATNSGELPKVEQDEVTRSQDPPADGDLSTLPAPALLATLWARRGTGILEVTTGSLEIELHLHQGRIVLARSNQPEHRLGEILLESGAISAEENAEALAAQQADDGRRLGALLVAHGALTLRELHEGLVQQVKVIVAALIQATRGRFLFRKDPVSTEDVIRAGSTPQLVLEACRELDIRPGHLRHMPNDRALLLRVWDEEETNRNLALRAPDRTLVEKLEPGTTLVHLLRESETDKEEMLRTLYAFIGLGVVQVLSNDSNQTVIAGYPDLQDLTEEVTQALGTPSDLATAFRELTAAYQDLLAENKRLRDALERRKPELVG